MPPRDSFVERHIGPSSSDVSEMLAVVGCDSLDTLIAKTVPASIRIKGHFALSDFPHEQSEVAVFARAKHLSEMNEVRRSFLGMGYYGTIVPAVIQRNILENPGWYTQYTPYQPEISQGRLEALLNFQTMISELTGFPVANASLLDEGTAAAEAMTMSLAVHQKAQSGSTNKFLVAEDCHPQTIAVVETRARALGISVSVEDPSAFQFTEDTFGVLLQYPSTLGEVRDDSAIIQKAKEHGVLVTVAADILSLVLLKSPAELGADIAVGSTQRFGVPLGFGGPHAAYFATKDDYKRTIPGRLVGVSRDATGKNALRLALQTREQHIRRERATSNICTAQVLLAIMAGMYAVYHGRSGLRRIAERVFGFTCFLEKILSERGLSPAYSSYFDTLTYKLSPKEIAAVRSRAENHHVNLRFVGEDRVSLSLDQTVEVDDVYLLAEILSGKPCDVSSATYDLKVESSPLSALLRKDQPLSHPIFNSYRSESEFLRYLKRLEAKDLSLCHSMIPLGSCTMKLNATSEMLPVSLPGFSLLHPFVPVDQAKGYLVLFAELEKALQEITGFDAVSLQPNAGSQGEYAGLLAIKRYHESKGDLARDVCLIPKSAHGTNPASAIMAGMKVVVVECDTNGNIDVSDLEKKAAQHEGKIAALMVTYPSTHGVFEEAIESICEKIHNVGGLVYLDGANLNALVGLSRPADFGADVCHINLHKTFCIPHGGGGPGMGPIAVRSLLAGFLPGHAVVPVTADKLTEGAVSAAPWGSSSILPISWSYMALMGAEGLKRASEVAILNANYIAKRLEPYFPVLYRGRNGYVAHECILDFRAFKKSADIEVADVAKRLMDYSFHAPTMSWPVPGTLMIEPTESESKTELDRFCDALIAIRNEIAQIESGAVPKDSNPLKHAPHTVEVVSGSEWNRPYSREEAAFPAGVDSAMKFWPAVSRIEDSFGDRNLVCTCPSIEEYQ
ncbi:MAG: aminomethyl-transferring glycine dehydrogenase [Bdellovibrionales bacterium]|nr:aminomethyl-transferring glycine dehydrogenase [Bdellovibrionales bacterium]